MGLVPCESNLLGIVGDGARSNVGSGGWTNIIGKFLRAKEFCEAPFEVERRGGRNVRLPIRGERIGEECNGRRRKIVLRCQSATTTILRPRSLDAVLTDPPYFGNVQYSELMDFCYVWLRRLAGTAPEGFERTSTRSNAEVAGNATRGRGLDHFAHGLSAAFRQAAAALKRGAPLAFTYHHNRLETYGAVGAAVLDAGLVCSASLPCPAEMGGSIHIRGEASSIVDTVFVCRAAGSVPGRWLFRDARELIAIAGEDVALLASAGRKPNHGDTRCLVFGHLARMAVWTLRSGWSRRSGVAEKMAAVHRAMRAYGDPEQLVRAVMASPDASRPPGPLRGAARKADERQTALSL